MERVKGLDKNWDTEKTGIQGDEVKVENWKRAYDIYAGLKNS